MHYWYRKSAQHGMQYSAHTAGVHLTNCVLKIRVSWQLFKHIFLLSWSIIHRYRGTGKQLLLVWNVHLHLSVTCCEIFGRCFSSLCLWFSSYSLLFASPGSHGWSGCLLLINMEHDTLDLGQASRCCCSQLSNSCFFFPAISYNIILPWRKAAELELKVS